MDFEHYFQQAVPQNDEQAECSMKRWKSSSGAVTSSDDPSADFECNICFDFVQDPVVTLCGHLYCWPCIYKWFHSQKPSDENSNQLQQQCPVCKAEVSVATLVPLYGRTTTKSSDSKAQNRDLVVPRRPLGPSNWESLLGSASSIQHSPHQFHDRTYLHQLQSYDPYRGTYSASPILSTNGTNTIHPIVGMLGEMVLERVSGGSASMYNYPNSYQLAGSGNARVRRHMMEAHKGLERMCFFLLCCAILCLFLF